MSMEPHQLNRVSFLIIQSAIQVHRALGPGLLESIYRLCLIYEVRERALKQVLIELKAVEIVLPVHHAQLLSYLRLTGKPLGLLINFNVPVLVDGVTRKMNGCPEAALDTHEQN
jgi:hypothetical protein